MKRIIVICEGQTEKEFCEKILSPHLSNLSIYVQAPLIKKSGGGIVGWNALKKQINLHLQENAYVTTFIDFYGIKDVHNFPNWDESKTIVDKFQKLLFLETGMATDINSRFFIPNIQLHEYESLIFSDYDNILNIIPHSDILDLSFLMSTFRDYSNPELINDGSSTAPSKRLERIINGYSKVLHGHYILEHLGIEIIRDRCGKFNTWLENIENIS